MVNIGEKMIAKLSWVHNTQTNTMTILKVDYMGWAKESDPKDIKEIVEFYEVNKSITTKEFYENEKYHGIMCTIVPLHRTLNVINV